LNCVTLTVAAVCVVCGKRFEAKVAATYSPLATALRTGVREQAYEDILCGLAPSLAEHADTDPHATFCLEFAEVEA